MLKVCHVTSAHKSQDVRILKKQCTSLAQAGYDTYLVAQGESYEENGVKVVGIGTVSGGRLTRMTKTSKTVYEKALELNCDVYHLHDPELIGYAKKFKKHGKKVVFDSHEDIVNSIVEKPYLNKFTGAIVSFVFDKYFRGIVKKIDAIVYASPHMEEYYLDLIKNRWMIANFPILTGDEDSQKPDENGKIVFAGGVSKQWCHHKIVSAIQKIDTKYTLCGPGSASYIEELKSLDTNNKLEYLGIIPHKEVKPILQNSSVGMTVINYCANTGWKQGTLGNTKIFEYMQAGLPIICTDFVLWKEIVDKYNCGICVDPDNTDEIAKAVSYLLENPKIAKQMGENGRRAVVEEYNWCVEESKLLKLYGGLSEK